MTNIAIMGEGMVGGALARYFASQGQEASVYDPPKGKTDEGVLRDAEIIFLAVPTPYHLHGTGFDDQCLRAAIEAIPVEGKIIVIKSTAIPGTTEKMQTAYPQHRFLFNPEFLTEATADEDMRHPNRQILGCTEQSRGDAERVMALLPRAPFEKITDARVAEIVKYFCNAFYALKVAYANQMHDLCQALGAEYDHVKACVETEPMVGKNHLAIFHKGYRGYGGKCLPKDVRALIQIAEQHGADLTLLKQAEAYNNALAAAQGIDVAWPGARRGTCSV